MFHISRREGRRFPSEAPRRLPKGLTGKKQVGEDKSDDEEDETGSENEDDSDELSDDAGRWRVGPLSLRKQVPGDSQQAQLVFATAPQSMISCVFFNQRYIIWI